MVSHILSRFLKFLRYPELQFPNNLFGKVPLADRDTYLRLHAEANTKNFREIDKFEAAQGFQVDPGWLEDLALHTQVVVKASELNWQHGRVLYSVLRRRIDSHQKSEEKKSQITILETGTARGYSSVCMARAMLDASQSGTVSTIDILPHNSPMLWNCIDDTERPKTRQELLEPWPAELERILFIQGWTGRHLRTYGFTRIHFAFLDAQHTEPEVNAEYEYIRDRQAPGDMIVFDDVSVGSFDGVVAAVDKIEKEGLYSVHRFVASAQRGYAIAERTRIS